MCIRDRAKAAELGLEIVKVTTFTDETTDFSVQVTETKNAGAELVFLDVYKRQSRPCGTASTAARSSC